MNKFISPYKKYGLVLLPILAVMFIPLLNIYNFISDDAYFYFVIAEHLAEGKGLTFNGIFTTNGFHPLWMFVLTPVAAISAKPLFIYLVDIVHIIFSFIAFGCLFKIGIRYVNFKYTLLSILPVSVLLGCLGTVGSEAALSAATISIAILCMIKVYEDDRHKSILILGLMLGLIMLARLDTVFLAGAIALWVWVYKDFKTSLIVVCYASLLVVPYLLYNYVTFQHHILPISGFIKSSFPIIGPNIGGLSLVHYILFLGSVVLLPLAIWDNKRIVKDILYVLFIGSSIQFLYHFLFSQHAAWYWYSILSSITFGLIGAFGFKNVIRIIKYGVPNFKGNMLLSAVYICFSISIVTLSIYKANQRTPYFVTYTKELNNKIPAGSVLFAMDGPGRLAYFGDYHVVADDGLTNNYKYYNFLANHKVDKLMDYIDADYIFVSDWNMLAENNCRSGGLGDSVKIENPKTKKTVGKIYIRCDNLVYSFNGQGRFWPTWKLDN